MIRSGDAEKRTIHIKKKRRENKRQYTAHTTDKNMDSDQSSNVMSQIRVHIVEKKPGSGLSVPKRGSVKSGRPNKSSSAQQVHATCEGDDQTQTQNNTLTGQISSNNQTVITNQDPEVAHTNRDISGANATAGTSRGVTGDAAATADIVKVLHDELDVARQRNAEQQVCICLSAYMFVYIIYICDVCICIMNE